jgi:hypothetical protein
LFIPIPWKGLKPAKPCFVSYHEVTRELAYMVDILDIINRVRGDIQPSSHLGQWGSSSGLFSGLGCAFDHVNGMTGLLSAFGL